MNLLRKYSDVYNVRSKTPYYVYENIFERIQGKTVTADGERRKSRVCTRKGGVGVCVLCSGHRVTFDELFHVAAYGGGDKKRERIYRYCCVSTRKKKRAKIILHTRARAHSSEN